MSSQTQLKKAKNILFSYYRKESKDQPTSETNLSSNIDVLILDEPPSSEPQIVESTQVDISSLERDPGLRLPIWSYPNSEHDNVRKAYIKLKACQPKLENYPETLGKIQKRRFNYSWFKDFPWLEYSESKDKAFCFPCFLFDKNPPRFPKFTVEGFDNWKKVKGDQCAFANHEGGPCSSHNNAMNNLDSLSDPSLHIDKRIQVQDSKLVLQNRLRLKTTIECVKWLAMQACAFRGHMNLQSHPIMEISLKC